MCSRRHHVDSSKHAKRIHESQLNCRDNRSEDALKGSIVSKAQSVRKHSAIAAQLYKQSLRGCAQRPHRVDSSKHAKQLLRGCAQGRHRVKGLSVETVAQRMHSKVASCRQLEACEAVAQRMRSRQHRVKSSKRTKASRYRSSIVEKQSLRGCAHGNIVSIASSSRFLLKQSSSIWPSLLQ
jgi:hypothetical protein